MIAQLIDRYTGLVYDTDDYQQEAYAHLMHNPRAALFLGMSLTKTVITASYLYDMHYREGAFIRSLVIAPDKVARVTWPEELDKWEHLQGARIRVIEGTQGQRLRKLIEPADIHIISVENIVWLVKHYKGGLPYTCVVIDELSQFKNRGSARFKQLRKGIKYVPYRIGLTGTPTPKGYIDLWAEMILIDDGQRLGDTWGKFLDQFFTIRGNGMIVYEYIPREGAVDNMSKRIADICLTMNTRDKVELPPDNTINEVLEFNTFDKEVYDTLEREYVLDLFNDSEVTVKTAADLTMKLLQITSGAIYDDQKVWQQLNTLKIDALARIFRVYPRECIIVVYQFRHEIDRIKTVFPFAREFGKGAQTKQTKKDWNDGKIRLLLLHPASAGHGLNLQFGGRRIIWYSLTYNLEHYLQVIARIIRRGAVDDIYIHRLLVKGTRDFKVAQKLDKKEKDEKYMKDTIIEYRRKYGL